MSTDLSISPGTEQLPAPLFTPTPQAAIELVSKFRLESERKLSITGVSHRFLPSLLPSRLSQPESITAQETAMAFFCSELMNNPG